jgi:DNA primase
MFQTVCHHGDSHKLYYYEETKEFHCYTSCSENMDIYELVGRARKISFPQAVQFVAKTTGKTFGFGATVRESNSELIDDWDWINRLKKKEKKAIELPEYNNNVLDRFTPSLHESWFNEGISFETGEKFGIGYYFREGHEAITIPHYDINNRLVGIRRRSLIEEDLDNGKKYMPITIANKMYGHSLMFNLYNLNNSKQQISKLRKVIIYESEKSCLKNHSIYGEYDFSVATCGSNISEWQAQTLIKLGVEEVFIAFDKEYIDPRSKQAEIYLKKLLKISKKFTPYVRTFLILDVDGLLEEKESPIDKDKQTLEYLLKNKIEVSTGGELIEK